jgi:hypothetical protein
MNQTERRIYLIQKLLAEQPEYRDTQIPADEIQQRQLLRGLMNIRMPGETDEEFCKVQDAYLQEELKRKGVVRIDSIAFNQEGLGFWKGDITRLAADAIVNAANVGCSKLIPLRVTATFKKSRNYGTLSWFSIMEKAA